MSRKLIDQHPCLKHHDVLEAVCQPLLRLGVHFFAYTAVDSASNAFCLGSKADYAAEYLRRNCASQDIHRRPDIVSNKLEYYFWDFARLDVEAANLYAMAHQFDQSHTLTITHHAADKMHCYHFSGRVADEGLNQRYLEQMDFLHAFIDYFNNVLENIPEVGAVYQQPINLMRDTPKEVPATLFITTDPRLIDLPTSAHSPLRFKNSSRYYLTDAERQCLFWLQRGKSLEMIAAIVGVTRKSIERRVSSIKVKFNCYTQYQLGQKIARSGLDQLL